MATPTWNENSKRDEKGRFVKGNKPFDRTGILHTKETKAKLRKARKGKTPRKVVDMTGKKIGRWLVIKRNGKKHGQAAWLCRCKCGTQKTLAGGSLRQKRGSKSCGCLQREQIAERNRKNSGKNSPTYGKPSVFTGKERPKHSKRMKGKNNPNWKGGIQPENRKIRNSKSYKKWRKSVFKRDGHTCQKCSQVGGKLRAHHIVNFSLSENLRMKKDNGVTLCKSCHQKFHSVFGRYENDNYQLAQFM